MAQVAIASTVLFTSISSTTILHLVSQPYVCKLTEISSPSNNRKFRAYKYNVLGNVNHFDFYLSDVSKPPAHPFASAQVKNHGGIYIYGENVQDTEVRSAMAKD
jgi:hypothetical protein